MRAPDELRALVEESLAELPPRPTLGALEEPIRYALGGGGKRIRPVLCLAVCEAAGGGAEKAASASDGARARPHVLARPRRPACARRRRRAARSAERPRRLRGGRGAPRRRRAPRGGVRSSRPASATARDRAGARAGDARDDRRAVPRRHRSPDVELERAPPPQDRPPFRGGGRARRSGPPMSRWRSRRRGARSATSSAFSSRPSTTCSTATATRPSSARTAHGGSPPMPRSVPTSGSTCSTPTRRCSRSSSTGSRSRTA